MGAPYNFEHGHAKHVMACVNKDILIGNVVDGEGALGAKSTAAP